VQVPDITPSTLNKIGEELDSVALSETTATPVFPVQGILFGFLTLAILSNYSK
jgi:hypothetical protein